MRRTSGDRRELAKLLEVLSLAANETERMPGATSPGGSITVRARLDAGRVGEAVGDEAMDRGSIEEAIRRHFGPALAGLGSALSEIRACFTFPEYLAGVLTEMGPDLTPEAAILTWAVRRGDLWR